MKRAYVALPFLFLTLVSLSTVARADDAPEPHARIAGVGTLLGGGYTNGISMLGFESGGEGRGPIRFAPQQGDADALTLELQFFNKRGHSVDISIPILKMSLPFLGAWVVNTDFFYNFNVSSPKVGRGIPRLVVGPGLGYTVSSDGSRIAGSIRFPSEIGLELLTTGHGFGFKILARPFWEIVFPQYNLDFNRVDRPGALAAAGCMGAIAFTGFIHR